MFNRCSTLIPVLQNRSSQIYVEQIITPIIYTYVFMDDNVRAHHARRVQDAVEAGHIFRLNWPVDWLDMNPIENMWY